MTARIHITGGSGSGTTTLGAHVARALDGSHMDADDFFWLPTDPPYCDKRPAEDRLALAEQMFLGRDKWVLSGSVMGWGDPLIQWFDLVVRLEISAQVRLDRLREREVRAYGERIQAGGDMEEASIAFFEWAAGYDDPAFEGRSQVRHERWCDRLPCRVVTLDSAQPVGDLVDHDLRELA